MSWVVSSIWCCHLPVGSEHIRWIQRCTGSSKAADHALFHKLCPWHVPDVML